MTAVPYELFYWRVCPCPWLMNRGFPNCNTCSIINYFISKRSTKHIIINLTTIHDHKVHSYYRCYKTLILYVKKKNNDTVNQLSFSTTMFHELPEINWFALINFCDQALSTSPGFFSLQLYASANTGPAQQEIFATMKLSRKFLTCE